MRDMTRGPILGHLFTMATPIAIGMLVQTLYYMVDLYFVSRLGDVALAGVSAAGNANFLMLAATQTLSVGTIAVVSHAVGAEDQQRANVAFHQAVLLAGFLGLATFLAGYLGLADFYIGSIAADAATATAGSIYLSWFIPGMALQFAGTAMGATLQGTGVVKPTMVVQLVGLLINIILTPILVAGWGTGHPMGVAGAGLASTLSSVAGVAMMGFYFARLERYVSFEMGRLRVEAQVLRRMLSIGLPSGAEFLLLFVYIGVVYAVTGIFGPAAQAGFGVGSRMMQAVFLPAMAISFATPAIAGQNFGARKPDRVRKVFATAALLNVTIMGGVTFFCQWQPELLLRPFSTDAAVLAAAVVFLTITSWNFVASGLAFTCSAMFQAIGHTLPALASSSSRLLTFVLPIFWLSRQPGFVIEHVWYLSVASVAIQAALSFFLLRWQLGRRLQFAGEKA